MASKSSIECLDRLQEASCRHFGLSLPTYSAEQLVASKLDGIAAKVQGSTLVLSLNRTSDRAYAEVARDYGDTPSRHIQPRDWWVLKHTVQLIRGVSPRFPHFGLDKLLDRCVPGTVLMGLPNAVVFPVQGTNEFLLLFDPTTFDYVSGVCDSLATLWQIREQIIREKGAAFFGDRPFGGPVLAPLLYPDLYNEQRMRALRTASAALRSFVCRGRPEPIPLDPGLDAEWTNFAEFLRRMCICFMMAHEIGHLLLHLDDKLETSAEWRALVRVMPAQSKEFQADNIAGDILAACAKTLSISDSHLLAGADMFFLCALLREVAVQTLECGEPGRIRHQLEESARTPYRMLFDHGLKAPTHPPTAVRYTAFLDWRLRAHAQTWKEMDQTSSDLTEIVDFMWKTACGGFLALHGQGVRPSASWFPADGFK